jgi:proteic killer suppression protein
MLNIAKAATDLDVPGWNLHRLHGERQEFWSLKVSGNWRLIFRFQGANVELVDYIDYH